MLPLAKTLPLSDCRATFEMAKVGGCAGTLPFAAPTRAWTLAGLPVAVIWLLTQNASSPLASRRHRDERVLEAGDVVAVHGLPAASVTAIETGRPRLRHLAGVAQLDHRRDAVLVLDDAGDADRDVGVLAADREPLLVDELLGALGRAAR